MAVADFSELAPETREVVDEYIERLVAGFCEVAAETVTDVLADVRAHLLEALDPDSTVEDARSVVAELGEPDEYAAAMCIELSRLERGVSSEPDSDHSGPGSGTFLGMPYDFRPPTVERVQRRWWDPTNPRVWVPKTFGAGWTVNFGALAVKLNLIRPDDEDEPFASVPDAWVMLALAVPLLETLAIGVTWVLLARSLPAEVPSHWDVAFQPDSFAPTAQALGLMLAAAAIPTAWAATSFVTGRSRGARVLVGAFASLFATLAGGIFATTVLWTRGVGAGWVIGMTVILALLVPFLLLVTLARINRREEWRRDIGH